MQHNHSMTNHKVPDYDFHMPRQLTYPLPVGIISITVGGLLYLLLQKSNPKIAGFLSLGIDDIAGQLNAAILAHGGRRMVGHGRFVFREE